MIAETPPSEHPAPSTRKNLGKRSVRSRHSELWRLVFILTAFVAVWGVVGALLLAGD